MTQANKEVVKRFLDALGAGDAETVEALITDDMVAVATGTSVASGTRSGKEIVKLAPIFKHITKAGISFEFLALTAEEDRVAAELQGHSELLSGERYDNQYHFLFYLRDGKICKMKEYFDGKLVDKALGPIFAQTGEQG